MAASARALATLLGVAGVTHFAVPKYYDPLIPRQLPGSARAWTYGSGGVELGVAAALALPATRRLGGLAAAALFVGVFPGNVQMALDASHGTRAMRVATLLRLPLQLPLVVAAWRVYQRS